MENIMLSYDKKSGTVTDGRGLHVGVLGGATAVESNKLQVSEIVILSDAGFDTDDIIKMFKEGLL